MPPTERPEPTEAFPTKGKNAYVKKVDSMLFGDGTGKNEYVKKVDLRKLATHEDPYHLHKTLGILSLCHFVYRYFFVLPTTGNLGFDGSALDWVCMTLHLMLGCSSLIFKVIKSRILKFPMIMWEEYRLHAIVFTLRCWSVFAVGAALKAAPAEYRHFTYNTLGGRFAMLAVVLAHHVAADYITAVFGTPGVTSVRVAQSKKTGKVKFGATKRLYSFYQFLAIASHLTPYPTARLMDLGFNTLIAIQSSAFLMTLCRKNIITWRTHGIIYTACLILSAGCMIRAMCFAGMNGWFLVASAVAVFYLRVTFRLNKYLLWAGHTVLTYPAVAGALAAPLTPLLPLAGKMALLPVSADGVGPLGVAAATAGVMAWMLQKQLAGSSSSDVTSSGNGAGGKAAAPTFLEGVLYLSGIRKLRRGVGGEATVTQIMKTGS